MKKIAFAALAAGFAASANAQAPAGTQGKGLMLNVHVLAAPGVTVSGEDLNSDVKSKFGAGGGIQIGYGFNPMWMLFGSLDVAKQGSDIPGVDGNLGLVHFEVGARANFQMGKSYIPYATVAVGARSLGAKVEDNTGRSADVSFSGGEFALGGGLQYFMSPRLALDGGVSLGFGKFGKFDNDGDKQDITVDNSMSTRLRVGINWYPTAKSK